ncbi:MAG: GntR family transcriptional regulator [Oscillospiraceae bacterium]|nr:GntR family transcriptional regulator [Oscillospiraceae bacterium]
MNEVSYKSPLYIQLREVIRSRIEDGEYPPGTALPSENQLAETYSLNRFSVRSAMDALEHEGLIRRIQGKGAFVCGPRTQRDMETLGGFRHTMQEHGKDAEVRILIKAVREAGPYYSRVLHIGAGDRLWFIRRVDSSGGEPVALEEIYIPYVLMPKLDEIDLGLFSLYDAMSWSGICLAESEQTLRITKMEPSLARLIDLSPEQAVMEFSYLTKDREGRFAEFSRCYIRGDRTEFFVHYRNTELI